MKTVMTSEIKQGDIIVNGINAIKVNLKVKKVTKLGVFIEVYGNYMLASSRWSKREDLFQYSPDKEVTIADSKKEAIQVTNENHTKLMADRNKRELEEMEAYAKGERLPFFVYGTLRPGFGNYYGHFDGHTTAEMPATIKGIMYASGVPFVIHGDETIQGNVLFVKDEDYAQVLYHVDGLEGYRPNSTWNNYTREKVVATLEDGSTLEAWCYFMDNDNYFRRRVANGDVERVPSGDYAQYRSPYTTRRRNAYAW